MARYLVVDDELPTTIGMGRLLVEDGHDVRCFTDGDRALAAMSTTSFDVIVIDLDLRGVSGHDLVRAARHHQPAACVFVTTVRAGLVVVPEACHIFGKPLEYESVARAVTSCRDKQGPGQHGKSYLRVPDADW
jgi:DNA-binding NtrC family response regulator